MKVRKINIFIKNENLDGIRDSLRNLGNYYIENDIRVNTIKRHKLARAGNCSIALNVCHFNPIYDDKYNIVDLEYDDEIGYDISIIFDIIKKYIEDGSYIIFEENNNEFILSFSDNECMKLNSLSEFKTVKKEFDINIIFCKDCMLYKNNCCIQKTKDDLEVYFSRNHNDYCSRAIKNTEKREDK